MYIISFDLAGVFLALILIMIHVYMFDNMQKTNKRYHLFTLCAAVECVLDIFTAQIIDGIYNFSDTFCVWMNMLYLISTLLTANSGYGLVSARLNHSSIFTKTIATTNLILGYIVIIYGSLTGILFRFENGEYMKTPYFGVVYVFSFIFMLLVPFVLQLHRNELTFKEKISPYFFMFVLVVTFIIQQLIPNVLLTGFGKALAAMVFCLYLETPEHIKLKIAVEDLKKSREEQLETIVELEKANKQKTEFIVSMSHQLRTPINVIMGFDQILLSECEDEAVKEDAEKLSKVGDELLDLVEDIVDFAQVETGELELHEREYDIVYANIFFMKRIKEILKRHNMNLIVNTTPGTPQRMYGDQKRICQIIGEILNVSLKGGENGDIILYAGMDYIEDNVAHMEIKIINSIGTDAQLKAMEEDDDYQLINRLIECMGGELNYSYINGVGSQFVFTYTQEVVDLKPVGDIEKQAKRYIVKKENTSNFIMPTARILVVDDTPVNLKVFEGIIKSYRVDLTMAESGKKTLEYMSSREFDLVFMDILMPDMDGIQTLHEIRAREGILSREVPVIALTANVFLGARKKYMEDGFSDYITKPLKKEYISNALKRFLPEKMESEWAELDVTDEELEDARTAKEYTFDDVPGLKLDDGLAMCMGDMNLYKSVIKEYCLNNITAKLEAFYADKDWDNYRILIHGAKSTAKTIGLNDLSEAARKLEMASKEKDIDYISANHRNWLMDYKQVVEVMEKLI